MGLVHQGIPQALALALRDAFSIKCFVETGTYVGATALWASRHFDAVATIELSHDLWAAFQAYRPVNVLSLQGDSRDRFSDLVAAGPPALIWLDGHYSGGITAGANAPCPLLDEIAAISKASVQHVVLVDDARLLGVEPGWPSRSALLDMLRVDQREWHALEGIDVLACVPRAAVSVLKSFGFVEV